MQWQGGQLGFGSLPLVPTPGQAHPFFHPKKGRHKKDRRLRMGAAPLRRGWLEKKPLPPPPKPELGPRWGRAEKYKKKTKKEKIKIRKLCKTVPPIFKSFLGFLPEGQCVWLKPSHPPHPQLSLCQIAQKNKHAAERW